METVFQQLSSSRFGRLSLSTKTKCTQAGINKLTDALYKKNPEVFSTKRAAKLAVKSVGEVLFDFLSSGVDVKWLGLGGFKINERRSRKGHNPQTGEELQIPAKKGIKFVPSKALRDKLNI
jgi:DNA-binding protein HU-beta